MIPARRYGKSICLGIVVVLTQWVSAARSDNPRYDYTPQLTGPVRVLPPTIGKEFRGSKGIGLTKVVFKDGETWQALVCAKECTLQPIVVNARSEVLLEYFNDKVNGQRLSVAKFPPGNLIALFQRLPPVVPGEPILTLLHRGMKKYPGSGRSGTMEIGIPPLGSERLRIVPRLTKAGVVRVYLESEQHRQLLGELNVPEMNAGPSDIAMGRNLLLWAGDIDGDQKPDFVMSFESWVGNDSSVVLFLSSLAKGRDFVGNAGSFFLAGQYD